VWSSRGESGVGPCTRLARSSGSLNPGEADTTAEISENNRMASGAICLRHS
jgi:hypothetical protein